MNDKNITAAAIYLIYCFIVILVLPISSRTQSILIFLGILGLSLFRYLDKKKKWEYTPKWTPNQLATRAVTKFGSRKKPKKKRFFLVLLIYWRIIISLYKNVLLSHRSNSREAKWKRKF